MEQDKPTFLSREQLEDIKEYQEWIRQAFLDVIAGVDMLVELRQSLAPDIYITQTAHDMDINLEPIQSIIDDINAQIAVRIAESTEELQRRIFEDRLFEVGIVAGDETWRVEGVVAKDERILPIVGGKPYEAAVDEVLFDR